MGAMINGARWMGKGDGHEEKTYGERREAG
jgi:hypothetical protein